MTADPGGGWEPPKPPRRVSLGTLLAALVAGAAVVGLVGGGVWGRWSTPGPLPGEGSTEQPPVVTPRPNGTESSPRNNAPARGGSAVGLPTNAASVDRQVTRCGTVRIAERDYGRVIVGDAIELRTPEVGYLIVLDMTAPVSDLRVEARRLRGPGRLRFEEPTGSRTAVELPADGHRSAPGWPPHWGVGARLSGPGCWEIRVTGNEAEERLLFEVSRRTWRRHWR